jgi:hypothetical protein
MKKLECRIIYYAFEWKSTTGHVGESEDSWHTFHVIIFHIFSVLITFNATARVGANILGLQSDLHKYGTIKEEK